MPVETPLLQVCGLTKQFVIRSPVTQRAVGSKTVLDDISFDLEKGRTLGIVGESGSGKSTLLRVLIGVVPGTAGEVLLDGTSLAPAVANRTLPEKRAMQMVFQDPTGALHPRMTVFRSLAETYRVHGTEEGRTVKQEIARLLEVVGLNPGLANRYPHQLSGGQRQRVVVARALAVRPRVLLCDDPVAALDVSLAAQVLNLFLDLQDQFGLSYIFVTNNLAVLRQVAHRIAIMRDGRFVETSERDDIYERPRDEYTRELLAAAPSLRRSLVV
jgi:ABC-type glutathione transport system ATPase component